MRKVPKCNPGSLTSGPKAYKSLLNLSLNLSAIFEMAIRIEFYFLFQIKV